MSVEPLAGNVVFALLGPLLILLGTVVAVRRRRNLGALIAWGGVAELGVAVLGLACGGPAGSLGALLVVAFQVPARLLAYGALLQLAGHGGSLDLEALRGSGRDQPATAVLFGFGLFACMGLSPFFTPDGRLLVLWAAHAHGAVLPLLLAAAAALVMAWLTIRAVQTVCFAGRDAPQAHLYAARPNWSSPGRPRPDRPVPLLWGLAGLLALAGIFEHPLKAALAGLLDFAPSLLPQLTDGWHGAALIPYAGAFAVWLLSRLTVGRPAPDSPTQHRVAPDSRIPDRLARAARPASDPERRARMRRDLAVVGLAALSLAWAAADGSLDPLARLFAVITGSIGLLVALYSTAYVRASAHGHAGSHDQASSQGRTQRREHGYYFFLLLMQGALMGLATTRSFGSFFFFWELMTWSSYFLIVHEGTRDALRAGTRYFVMCAGGAALLLPGLLLLAGPGGDLDFASVAWAAAGLGPAMLTGALLLTLIGFAVKAGLVPLHGWLPLAHPVAPSSISAPLSGLLTKTGVYGLARVFLAVCGVAVLAGTGRTPAGLPWISAALTTLGLLTMAWGEVMALLQTDIKRLLAYSTMGQIGEIVLVLGLSSWLSTVAALSHVLNHAVMKDLLFFCAGALVLRAGGRRLCDLAGLGRVMPWTAGAMTIGVLAIMGMPPFAGFSSKYLMLRACVAAGRTDLAAALLLASLAGAVYYMRILRQILFKPYSGPAVADPPWAMRAPIVILAALCVLLGVAPQLNLALVVPVADMLAAAGKVAPQALPSLAVSWPPFVVVPMLGAFLPLLLRRDRRLAGWAAVGVLAVAALAVALFGRGLDTLSFTFALLVPVVGCVNMVYAVGYMEHSHTQWRFYTFFLFMVGGLMGVAASTDLFSFFTFWEIMSSWTLYFVIVHDEFPRALKEGYKYFFFNVLGAAFLFLGVILLTAAAGSPRFAAVSHALPGMSPWTAGPALALMALGFAMKAAQLPLRIDIQMHPCTAPTPVSGYISSVLLKSAIFGLLKLFFGLGGAALATGAALHWEQSAVMHALAWVGGLTIVLAALMAVLQSDLKLVLIYSTVSQLGYMVLGVSLGTALGAAGGLLHLLNHVLFKDLLFLVAGALIVQTGKHSLDELGGIGRRMPVTLAVFAVGALCVVGVPPSNGFTSKWIIYHALIERGEIALAILSLVGSVLTLAYFAKYLHEAFLGQASEDVERVTEAPRTMLAPMLLLAAGCVVTSVFPGVFLLPVARILAELGLGTLDVAPWGLASGPGAWNATAVSVLAATAFLLGRWGLKALTRTVRLSPVHTCGERVAAAETRMASRDVYGVPGRMLQRFTARFIPAAKEE